MGKISSILLILSIFLSASIIDDYKNKEFDKLCNFNMLKKYENNEKILSLIGDSCVKTNNLYLLPYIICHLKYTVIGRKNSIYFLVIYNEKKLLYSFLFDNFNISSFNFPKTDYILSIVFEAIKNKQYKKINDVYIIRNKNIIIKMYKENDKMIIEKSDGIKNKRYWFR